MYSSSQIGPILLEIPFGLTGPTTPDKAHFDVSFKASNVRIEDQIRTGRNNTGNLLKPRKGKGQQTQGVIKVTEVRVKENTPTEVEVDSQRKPSKVDGTWKRITRKDQAEVERVDCDGESGPKRKGMKPLEEILGNSVTEKRVRLEREVLALSHLMAKHMGSAKAVR